MSPFATRLLAWYDRHGRHDLPWQHPRSAYRVWLSEVMLQQTQVSTVIPYFERFVARFPDLTSLAAAPLDEVLRHWAGLGYYARARHLHRAAQQMVARHGGAFPSTLEEALALPGLGRSTAAAVLAQAQGAREAILDGNVKRLMARHADVPGWPGSPAVQKALWAAAEARLPAPPAPRMADYTQAQMDLGALICRARDPRCRDCPVAGDCAARLNGTLAERPGRKPARLRPLRHARLWVLQREDGAIWFERRPPSGLWGGLWCPPLALDAPADEPLPAGFEALGQAQPLQGLRHGFTHFELEIAPWLCRARTSGAHTAEPQGRWTRIEHAPVDLALPAPLTRLLALWAEADLFRAPP
ncbi:MAG TPA: A/G-specific adenine glycosylase [Nevskiaceae bacterium]|nr:A/G-specific adenine glycosylase [Nevskiaceae bacterium]